MKIPEQSGAPDCSFVPDESKTENRSRAGAFGAFSLISKTKSR